MSRILSASQWARLDEARKPAPPALPLSSRDGGDVVAIATNGARLVAAA